MAHEEFLSIDSRIDDQVGLVTLDGRLMAETRFELDRIFRDWIDSGLKRVIVSCRNLDYIDSAGLSTMIGAMHRMRRIGGDLILSEMNPELQSLFELTSMLNFFKIFADLPEARSHFRAEIAARRKSGKTTSIKVGLKPGSAGGAGRKPKPRTKTAKKATTKPDKKKATNSKSKPAKKKKAVKTGPTKSKPKKRAAKSAKKAKTLKKRAVEKKAAPKRVAKKAKPARKKVATPKKAKKARRRSR